MKPLSTVATMADCPETLEEARGMITAQAQQLAALRCENAELRIDLRRGALWASNLSLRMTELRRALSEFRKGVSLAHWRPREPRVIGFADAFNALLEKASEPVPEPVTREQMVRMMAELKKENTTHANSDGHNENAGSGTDNDASAQVRTASA